MAPQERPYEPPLSHRIPSTLTIAFVGFLSRTFLYALSETEVHGLDNFLRILDDRKDEKGRERGLITVSNHLSVLDDPMIWGVLPMKYFWDPNNMRWSLGSYDICFKNGQYGPLSKFFTYGNTLPTQRLAHSPYGGLFQPTTTQCIRLLSDPHGQRQSRPSPDHPNASVMDPSSSSELTYSTNSVDNFPSPSAYPSRRHSWLHIFPEGMIHQHPEKAMRYFKWGLARLVLESEPCPDVVPMWIDGPQEVMSEKRTWPRWVPRAGKRVSVTFGEKVGREEVLEPLRGRWRDLKERVVREKRRGDGGVEAARREGGVPVVRGDEVVREEELGEVWDEELRYGEEAQKLRIEVTLAIRNEVLKVRRSRGLPDEDPKRGLAETFRREGPKREGVMKDRSIVKDM